MATALFILAGCETDGSKPPTVSLAEAEKVAAEFKSQSFTPPPKTIDDITAVLDRQEPVDPATIERARAASRAEPPADATGHDLAAFLRERGVAAGKVSDVRRQLADLRQAERLFRDADDGTRHDILWDLVAAELLTGNFTDANRHREQALDSVPANRRGAFIGRGALLAVHLGRAGNLEAADRLVERSENVLSEAYSWRSWREWGTLWSSHVERAKANLLDARGRHSEAERHYRVALDGFTKDFRDSPSHPFGALMIEAGHAELAENLVRQDRLVEAEIEARNALTRSLARVGRYSTDTALQLRTLVRVIAAQGRHREAERLARDLVEIYTRIGAPRDSFQAALARALLANTLVSQNRWPAALKAFDAIKADFATDAKTFDQFFARDINWAVALAGVGRAAEAERVARLAWRRHLPVLGPSHYLTAEARGVLAIALAKMARRQEAMQAFAESVPVLLTRSRRSADESGTQAAKQKRLGLILEAYIDLLANSRDVMLPSGRNAVSEAFRVADVSRGQSVQRALSASTARTAARDPELAELGRREQDAVKQIGALHGLLARVASAPAGKRSAAGLRDLRGRVDRLRGARAALAREIEGRFPDYATLMSPKPATIEQARAALHPGEALIATVVGTSRTYVWAVPRSGPVRFATAPIGAERIAATVGGLRRALDPMATTLGQIPAFDLGLSHRLYDFLLAPVRDGWKDADTLLVVAHGALGQLPFSVLVTAPGPLKTETEPLFSNYRAVRWLARSHAVTALPSVSSLATLRRISPTQGRRRSFVGFGDPLFSKEQAARAKADAPETRIAAIENRGILTVRGLPVRLRAAPRLTEVSSAGLAMLPRLPDTASEVKGIAIALEADPTHDVFTGALATEGRVKTMALSGYRVIAFATHGLVPGDLDGLVQPALALSSPAVVGGGDDGLLTMGEILSLRLDSDWVVLSACNTAAGRGEGAEAVSGLGRAFFYAGTRALLVSNWPVETTSARALTTDLFRRQAADAHLSRAQALRQAMLALINDGGRSDERGRIVFSYAHPIFWAPFSLVGDGGRAREPETSVSA